MSFQIQCLSTGCASMVQFIRLDETRSLVTLMFLMAFVIYICRWTPISCVSCVLASSKSVSSTMANRSCVVVVVPVTTSSKIVRTWSAIIAIKSGTIQEIVRRTCIAVHAKKKAILPSIATIRGIGAPRCLQLFPRVQKIVSIQVWKTLGLTLLLLNLFLSLWNFLLRWMSLAKFPPVLMSKEDLFVTDQPASASPLASVTDSALAHMEIPGKPDVPESTPAQVEISAAPEDLALSISDSVLAHLKMPSATPDDFVPSVSDSVLVQMRTPFLVEIPSVVDVPAPSAAVWPESLVAVDVPAADLGLN